MSRLLMTSLSKYTTIYQYLELGVSIKGQTVRELLGELEEMLTKSDNPTAHANIADVRKIFEEVVADGILNNDLPVTQTIILIKLEMKLYEKTINDSDAPDRGLTITSTRD